MKKWLNGQIVDMTDDELKKLYEELAQVPIAPNPSAEDQIAELKAQLTALETILLGGETNG